jgi:hypothetical protein
VVAGGRLDLCARNCARTRGRTTEPLQMNTAITTADTPLRWAYPQAPTCSPPSW